MPRVRTERARLLRLVAAVAVALCLLPIGAVALAALGGGTQTLGTLLATVLPRYAGTTAVLALVTGAAATAIGTGAAWLVTMTRFPGVRLLEVALALPLTFPAYVLAYAYTDFLDHPGAVQTALRALTGWGPRDYWFPEIRSLGGAAAMLTLVLYPYVYLLARAAFLQQSATAYLAARTLGHGAARAFLRVSLPVARPAIAAGLLLVLMETIADYGTVAYFGVQTFATGIFRSWFSLGDRTAAAQLALALLVVALALAWAERAQRGEARHHGAGRRFERIPPVPLSGWQAGGAALFCGVPVVLGFLLPVVLLVEMGWRRFDLLITPRYVEFLTNSLTFAAAAAVVTVTAAVALASNARLFPSRRATAALRISTLGYAVPGGVIAVGLLVPFAAFDNALDAAMRYSFGVSTGLLVTGSMWLLVAAYMVRFMAAALGAYDAGLQQVNPNVDAVARTLGRSAQRTLWGVHLPIVRPSVLTALLIVFIDVMKELPATLIMRPLNFDTLAVQAHRLAADERLSEAAVPSLVIGAAGLLPVLIVCRGLGRRSGLPVSDLPEPVRDAAI